MRVGIMQPYFLPYIGYFQLVNAVDKFVIYDNIQFVKKGWINRNRILVNGRDEFMTIPLKRDSDYLDIVERQLADTFEEDKQKIIRRIRESYRKAPHFENIFPLTEDLFNYEGRNLFSFVFNSIQRICSYLEISTEFVVSSSIEVDHSLKAEQRVMAIAKSLGAQTYINPIGGLELYRRENFYANNMELKFIQCEPVSYKQFNNEFVPWLSILDVMMFNSKEEIRKLLHSFTLK